MDVTGAFGDPNVSVELPVQASEIRYADLTVGDGAPLTSETQNAIMTRVLVNGDTGEAIHGALSVWSPQSASDEFPGVGEALECATEGSRIVVAIPAGDLPEGMAAQVGLSGDSSMLAVYDIRYTLLPKAEGQDVFNTTRNVPSVVRAPDGRPGIIVPDSAAPKTAVTETLIAGEGDKVGDGAPMFHFTAVNWNERSVTGSSWDGPVTLSTDSLPEDVTKAISKATIGSQIMVVAPDDAGNATVYVVDILGVIPEEMTQG